MTEAGSPRLDAGLTEIPDNSSVKKAVSSVRRSLENAGRVHPGIEPGFSGWSIPGGRNFHYMQESYF